MKNGIVKIESTQLEEVVKNSGLAIIEAEEIKTSYLPFLSRLVQVQDQATKINFESPTMIDETIARELRLATVKIRTDAEKLKDEQKRVDLLRGKVKQDSYNLIASSCKLAEEVFYNVEKARELAEKKRKEQLRIDRSEKLSPYSETINLYNLGEMTEDQFTELYTGLRTAHELNIESEKKAEEKRLADIEAERIRNEKIRLENERLKKEAEEKEKALYVEREKIRKGNEEKERLAEIERKKNAAILKAEQEKASKERAELLAKAEIERKEKERLAKEIEDKRLADEKAKKDLLAKLEAEKKAKLDEEKKSKLAPDKTKLLAFGQALNDIPRPEIKSIEAAEIMSHINGYLVKLNNFIIENANKL
jgi:hypothetical protein